MRSLGWALIQHGRVPIKMGDLDTDTSAGRVPVMTATHSQRGGTERAPLIPQKAPAG